MTEISKDHPVMVTGASGYIGGHVAARFLAEGLTVRAPVRNPDSRARLAPLVAVANDLPGTLELSTADLMSPGSYEAAAQSCQLVVHTASPFETNFDDPQTELVDPAVKGTENVLSAANASSSVKRVVLTSSCAAIYGDNTDLADAPGDAFTEAVWNTTSSLDHQPYSYSKTLAERRAWELQEAQDRWDLVTINPGFVIGPALGPGATSDSFAIATQIVDGTMRFGAPDMTVPTVDVRDVADAHYLAGFRPEATGRHILSAEVMPTLDLVAPLREKFGKRLPLPKSLTPKALMWLVGPIASKGVFTRKVISRNVGVPIQFDNSKSREALGIDYRPVGTALVEMIEQLIDSGAVKIKPE